MEAVRIIKISIHPPRVGRDRDQKIENIACLVFQSTLPVWGGTLTEERTEPWVAFQSTLPVWGGT